MKNRKPIRRKGKVFLLPDIEERILNKAMSLIDHGDYREARPLFGKLLELNTHDVKGLYGWSICSIELGEYASAEKMIRRLLETAPDDGAFRLYLTILIEKKDYAEAIRQINQWSTRNRLLPPEMQQFLKQMRRFCETRLNEPSVSRRSLIQESSDEETEQKSAFETISLNELKDAEPEQLFALMKQSGHQLSKDRLSGVERLLLDDSQNAQTKTMLLCMVKESGAADEIKVRKFGRNYRVDLNSPQFLYKTFADQIEKLIKETIISVDPTLASMAIEIGRFFTMNVYPKPLKPFVPEVWAALFSARAAAMNQLNFDEQHICHLFDVSEKDLKMARETVSQTEDYGIW